MAKIVGFACSLKLSWLNKAAQLYVENLSFDEYKNALNEYLKFEIDEGTTRLRKTKDILMHLWYKKTEGLDSVRNEAIAILNKYPEYAGAIHYCIICKAYPVFSDICRFIGRLLEFQENFTNAQLTKKLYDEWGERGALQTTCRRVTLTLRELGLLQPMTKLKYAPCLLQISKSEIVGFLLESAMSLEGKSYYSMSELSSFCSLFPFEITIDKEMLILDPKFVASNLGGELTIALK